MTIIDLELPLNKNYIDLIEQFITIFSVFICYSILEKSEKITISQLINYSIIGIMFHKLIISEIISFNTKK